MNEIENTLERTNQNARSLVCCQEAIEPYTLGAILQFAYIMGKEEGQQTIRDTKSGAEK